LHPERLEGLHAQFNSFLQNKIHAVIAGNALQQGELQG
jgi:hypothetical protein